MIIIITIIIIIIVIIIRGEEGGEKTLKLGNTEQDARNTMHCKTKITCKHTHINCNSKLLTRGALEIAPQQASIVTQTLAKTPEHRITASLPKHANKF